MGFPPDVPVHRGRVGAMRVASAGPADTFKPYVYRGTGVDTLTGNMSDQRQTPPRPKPKPEPKPEPRPKPKPEPKPEPKPAPRPKPKPKPRPVSKPKPYPKPQPVQHVAPKPKMIAPEKWVDPLPARPHPAKGWQPTSGADIERMLAELEEDE